jgi:DNA-binding winged helix-turn-helix (wHTH) protein/TolB-like protein/Flp pilus assembly protein TadD
MSTRFYEFGPFQIDKLNHVLLRDGETLPLKPKVFDTLLLLVENRGRVLDKDELLTRLWPDTVVEESNLSQNVYLLRKVLGEEPRGEAYIETMPKRGYRFVASVNEVEGAGTDLIPEEPAGLRLGIEKDETKMAPKYAAEAAQAMQEKALAASRWEKQASSWRLSALAVAGFLLVFGMASVFYVWIANKSKSVESRAPIKSIAVLPFKSLGTDPGDDYLGLGMADTLITRLSSVNQIVVRETSAVRKFTSPNQDPVAAGRELKVDAVLEASIQRAGDRVRVTLRLVSVKDGSSLWTRIVDEQVNDPFAVQDRVAEQVAQALLPRMTGEEKSLVAKHYTENGEAYRLYMLGRYRGNRSTVEDWKKAIEYFNAATDKDPNYALAYTGLANMYLSLIADSLIPKAEAIPKAKQAAMTALRLDDSLAEAHVSAGRIKTYYDWDWTGAEREFMRAIELNPNSGDAHREYAAYLTNIGRSEQAIAEAKRARDLDPLTLATNFQVAWALISAHRYDEAIEQSQEAVATFPTAHFWIGLAYLGKGMYEQAVGEFEEKLRLSKDYDPLTRAHLGYAYAMLGRKDEAAKVLAELRELHQQRQASPYYPAIVYAGLEDKDQAFAWLEEAYREHSRPLASGLKVNPVWDRLHPDPRFADLLRRMGLPQ